MALLYMCCYPEHELALTIFIFNLIFFMSYECPYLAGGLTRSQCAVENWVGGVSGEKEAYGLLEPSIPTLLRLVSIWSLGLLRNAHRTFRSNENKWILGCFFTIETKALIPNNLASFWFTSKAGRHWCTGCTLFWIICQLTKK